MIFEQLLKINHRSIGPMAVAIPRPITSLLYCIYIANVFLQTNGQQNPSIVHITPGQEVDLGDTVDLSCSVQYGANYPIIWTKLSENPSNPPLFISRDAALTVLDNRYSIRHDDSSSTYTLQVSKVSFASLLCWLVRVES